MYQQNKKILEALNTTNSRLNNFSEGEDALFQIYQGQYIQIISYYRQYIKKYRNMKKPQDSDIFGTKSTTNVPRIQNNQYIDPNARFQARMNAQYEAYTRKIGSSHRDIFDPKVQHPKVNEEANFDEYYHRYRKDADLQSTIFYQPTLPNSRVIERPKITQRHVPKHAYSQEEAQLNFGKKQTLTREVKKMPQNTTQFKGNSSNIFGYDQRADRNGVKNKIDKLIPHQMQWDQHDSIKHQDHMTASNAKSEENQGLSNISESRSELFNKEQVMKKMEELKLNDQKSKENNSNAINMMKKKTIPTNPEQKPKTVKKQLAKKQAKEVSDSNKVEISILKGWSSNIMEELSKYCRISGTKIMSINFEEGGKGTLVLDRSKRWENVTDWLRKDAKLKIRVMN